MHQASRSHFLCRLAASVVLVTSSSLAGAEEVDRVEVTNLPKVQTVDGAVEVVAPIPQTRLERHSEVVVSPVEPADTTNLVLAGSLNTAGFSTAVLSLTGSVRAAFYEPGRIGAILIPDVGEARTALLEEGELLFPLEVEAVADAGERLYFASDQPLFRLAFPRYRIYFYNTTDRPATVTLFAYLGN